jgi:hypothetical protein
MIRLLIPRRNAWMFFGKLNTVYAIANPTDLSHNARDIILPSGIEIRSS